MKREAFFGKNSLGDFRLDEFAFTLWASLHFRGEIDLQRNGEF